MDCIRLYNQASHSILCWRLQQKKRKNSLGQNSRCLQKNATFYTNFYDSYEGVIPKNRHHAVPKQAGKTNHVEWFNGISRGRIPRLVRDSLSFSKDYVLAGKFFICHCNINKIAVLHVQHCLFSDELFMSLEKKRSKMSANCRN